MSLIPLTAVPVVANGTQAICVPWQPVNPAIPHYTYDGASTTLKGIARGDFSSPNSTYTWDFGDGKPSVSGPITNPYNLGVSHIYDGVPGQLFIATLTVNDGVGGTDSDTYPIQIYEYSDPGNPSHQDVKINMAIDEGLWNLHTTLIRATYAGGSPGYGQPYGYWTDTQYGYHLAATGAAVDAFQLHGSKANGDYDSDPYVETVQRALNYLLYKAYSFSITPQLAGNPDTNGNGIGIVINHSSSLSDGRQTYIGGICMVALASSGTPGRVAAVGGSNVYDRTYAEIVQDMVDFFAFGQVDANRGVYRGGWRYAANNTSSDMSTTQWPALGMMAAEANMGSTIPEFVRTELMFFLTHTQYTALNNNNGAFGYTNNSNYINITKAGAGIICHEFIGTPITDSRIEKALGYIYRHWNDNGSSWLYQRLLGNSYQMYALMKAMRIPEPDILEVTNYDYFGGSQTTDTFDWYYTPTGQSQQGLATYLVNAQQTNGSWDDLGGPNPVRDAFSTGWGVLILLKGVAIIPPVAQICDCGEHEYDIDDDVHLDGSCSYHPDLTKNIVLYEWDLDNDGNFDDAVGQQATITGGFSTYGYHTVGLRVTDDNPVALGGPQTGIVFCEVYVHPPCHDPNADANGPYTGLPTIAVALDASGSWDPDTATENLTYEWDLDNDGLFGTDDDDCFGEPDDAVGVNPSFTFPTEYFGVIALKVSDGEVCFDGQYEPYDGIDIAYTTVDIGNHPPVSDPNGPYTGYTGQVIQLDGTASWDPDVGDAIDAYAWDLDGDGQYDDAFTAEPDYTVPAGLSIICLEVMDTFGAYDRKCTIVEVNPNSPPVISGLPDISLDEDTSLDNEIDLWAYASDAEDPDIDLAFSIVGNTNPDCGVSIDIDNRYIDISPTPDWNGYSDVTIQVMDTGGLTDTDTFRITVNPVNDPPIAEDDAYVTDEDTPLNVPPPGVLANDSDVDGDTITVTAVDTSGTTGEVTAWDSDGSFTYDPNGQFESLDDGETDVDTFTYTASDGNGGIDTATVTINIEGVNDAPVASHDEYFTVENTQLVVAAPGVLANDTDIEGDALTAVLVDDVTHGSLTLNTDGSFTYDPDADFCGIDSFTYMANDGDIDSNEVTVTIVVTGSSDCMRTIGFWKHQFSDNGRQHIDDDTLAGYLDIVGYMSEMFEDLTTEQVTSMLWLKKADMRERATQQLLASWLNFANGAVTQDMMVDTDRDGVADTTFMDAMAEVESILGDEDATKEELEHAKDICDSINNMKTCDEGQEDLGGGGKGQKK
jgi:VCBS repeat-containing protein